MRRCTNRRRVMLREPRTSQGIWSMSQRFCSGVRSTWPAAGNLGSEVLAAAARENRKRMRRDGGGDWAIVLELGEPVAGSLKTETTFAGDVGVQREDHCRIVRVVRPTQDEVKRFGTPTHKRRVPAATAG